MTETMPRAISRAERAASIGHSGATVWLTGLPAAGKTTLSIAIERELLSRGHHAYKLDETNCAAISALTAPPAPRTSAAWAHRANARRRRGDHRRCPDQPVRRGPSARPGDARRARHPVHRGLRRRAHHSGALIDCAGDPGRGARGASGCEHGVVCEPCPQTGGSTRRGHSHEPRQGHNAERGQPGRGRRRSPLGRPTRQGVDERAHTVVPRAIAALGSAVAASAARRKIVFIDPLYVRGSGGLTSG